MDTITIFKTVYNYEELSDTAQDKAYEKWLEHHEPWFNWEECIFKNWADELEKRGYDIDPDKDFDWNIGDRGEYVAFNATVNVKKWLDFHKLGNKYRAFTNMYIRTGGDSEVIIRRSSGRWSGGSMSAVVDDNFNSEDDPNDKAGKDLDEILDLVLAEAQDIAGDIRRECSNDYEYQYSKEEFLFMLEANEWEFEEDGKLFLR